MAVTLGLLLSENNARRRMEPNPRVGLVLLERLLFDPPRAAATTRWAQQVRRAFPRARQVPYVWHLVSHSTEDGVMQRTSRKLGGEARRFGHLQDTVEVRQAWEVSRLCTQAVNATSVVLRTPPSLTPGALGRSRLRAFVQTRKAEGIEVVWEPQGLWSPEQASLLAQSLGIELLLPAFEGGRPRYVQPENPRLGAPGAWLRIDGFGPRQGIHAGHVDALLDHVDAAPHTVLVFAGPRALVGLHEVANALGI